MIIFMWNFNFNSDPTIKLSKCSLAWKSYDFFIICLFPFLRSTPDFIWVVKFYDDCCLSSFISLCRHIIWSLNNFCFINFLSIIFAAVNKSVIGGFNSRSVMLIDVYFFTTSIKLTHKIQSSLTMSRGRESCGWGGKKV